MRVRCKSGREYVIVYAWEVLRPALINAHPSVDWFDILIDGYSAWHVLREDGLGFVIDSHKAVGILSGRLIQPTDEDLDDIRRFAPIFRLIHKIDFLVILTSVVSVLLWFHLTGCY